MHDPEIPDQDPCCEITGHGSRPDGLDGAVMPSVLAGAGIGPLDVDPLTSKPLVLRGRIVMMTGEVIDDGAVYLREGRIEELLDGGAPAPEGYETAAVIDTEGVIYPGMMDLHNHLAYNAFRLLDLGRKYTNRSQWRKADSYVANIRKPADALNANVDSAMAVARYVEVKLLVGGVTTSQGISKTNNRDYRGLVRNIEYADDSTTLPDVLNDLEDIRKDEASIEKFRKRLVQASAVMHHLAEGVNDTAKAIFPFLRENGLVQPSLVAIHALGLGKADFNDLAAAGGKMVWSPLSNSLLYAKTVDPSFLTESGVTFSLGCDWCPSGSKNLLQEMKVARLVAEAAGVDLSDELLCQSVTSNAAKAAAWDKGLGTLEKGKYADLVVVSKRREVPIEI